MPDAEFSSYYGQPIVKPVPWDHKISAYLFVGGIAGVSGIVQAGAAATGNSVLQRNSRLTAMAAVGLSGIALVADLGRPERFLNMMRTVKLTSPMSVGTWILSAYAGFAGVTTGAEVLRLLPSRGPVPALTRVTAGAAWSSYSAIPALIGGLPPPRSRRRRPRRSRGGRAAWPAGAGPR